MHDRVKAIAQWILPNTMFVKLSEEGPKRYFFHTGWNLLGRILSLFVAFFVNIYVIRTLGPSDYGFVSYVLSYVGLFGFIAGLGVDGILYIDLIEHPEKKNELLGTGFYLKLIGSLFAIVLVLISVIVFGDTLSTSLIIMLSAGSLVFQSFFVINVYFQAKVFSRPVVINAFVISMLLSLLKVLVLAAGLDVAYFVGIFILENIITACGYVFLYSKHEQNIFDWTFRAGTAKRILSQSWPLVLSTAFVVIYLRIDQVMINNMINRSSVGVYDAAVRLAEVWYFIPATIAGSLFPAVVNARTVSSALYEARLIKLYASTIYFSLCIILPITFFAHWIIKVLYGVEFIAAGSVLRITVWAGIFSMLGVVVNQVLIHDKLTRISFIINFIAMCLNVGLNIIFIPKWQINGAAFATLISYSVIPLSTVLFRSTRKQSRFMLKALLLPGTYLSYGKK